LSRPWCARPLPVLHRTGNRFLLLALWIRSESPPGAGSQPPYNRCFDKRTVPPNSFYVRRRSLVHVVERRRGVSRIILYGQMAENKKNRLFRFTIISSSSTPVACGCVNVCMCLCVREFRVRRVGRFSYSFSNIHLKTIAIILNGNKITICTRPCARFFHGESSEETSPTFE